MIECNEERTRIEGNFKIILNEWTNITRSMYYETARQVGLRTASEIFGSALQFAANDAADELKEKGELPDE